MPEVLMPRLSDTMAEGTLVQWLKREGDDVHRGDVLAEVETDKAIMEIEAYENGILTRILAEPGSVVPIGQPIAVIGDQATATVAEPVSPSAAITPAVRENPRPPSSSQLTSPMATRPADGAAGTVPTSPLARAVARRHGLDLARIVGTGPGGRVVRADVEAAVAAATPTPDALPEPKVPLESQDERVPLTTIRRITAQRLTDSAAAPHFYLTSVTNADPLLSLRTDLNAVLTDTGSKVTVTDLLIRACALMLRGHPDVNASWGGDHLLRHGRVSVGFAVALEDGLIVPVVLDADRKNLTEIAAEARRLTQRARAGKLTPEEFSGGTFTISNLGMYGIDHFTAVINPPEAAILAVGAAREEAVVHDGQLVAAHTMKLTLSIDHRVLDGATAASFLRDLVDLLEHPLRIVV